MIDEMKSLRVQLATALRERDTAKDLAHQLNSVALERGRQIAFERERFSEARKELTALRSERDALRAENERLRSALMLIVAPVSYSENAMTVVQNTARAALAGGGDRE